MPSVESDPIEAVVLARGSQRLMDRTRGLPQERAAHAHVGGDARHRRAASASRCTTSTELEPGVYRWPDLSAPARPGALRDELYRVCLDQGLAHDAAFVVIGATDVGALDDRAYREAQLAAGLVEGRLHLLAYASVPAPPA